MILIFTCQKIDEIIGAVPRLFGRQIGRVHLPELDGLRCLAILLVMTWHASLRAARYYDSTGGDQGASLYGCFPHGEIGVLLFFVISGFIVSLPFIRRTWAVGDVRNFYKRRFVRIYPPYAITLTIAVVTLGFVGHVPLNANSYQSSDIPLIGSFLASMVYMHGLVYDAPSRLNPPMWSLELEIAFYCLLPALMLAYGRVPAKTVRCAILLAVIVGNILAIAVLPEHTGSGRFRVALWHYGYYFLAGILLAELVGSSIQTVTRRYRYDVVFVVGCALLFGIGLAFTDFDANLPRGAVWVAVQLGLLGLLLIVFVSAFSGRITSHVLSLPWISFLGVCCYSLYLTHVPVMQAVSEVLPRVAGLHNRFAIWLVWLAVLLPASICSGVLFYVVVERPFALAASALGRGRAGVVGISLVKAS